MRVIPYNEDMETSIKLFIGAILLTLLLFGASYYLLFPKVEPQESPLPQVPEEASIATSTVAATSTPPTPPSNPRKEVNFVPPYPLVWKDGDTTLSLTGAIFDAKNLTFRIKVQIPDHSVCVPVNLRRLIDEAGNFAAPATSQFEFPDSGGCIGTINATYENQEITFPVRASDSPFIFTTGGDSKIFFIVLISDAGQISVQRAPTSE